VAHAVDSFSFWDDLDSGMIPFFGVAERVRHAYGMLDDETWKHVLQLCEVSTTSSGHYSCELQQVHLRGIQRHF
jgi:hypothetical protein